MTEFLHQALDWLVLQAAAKHMPREHGLQPNARAANELIADAGFFGDEAGAPADWTETGKGCFEFTSPDTSRWPNNNTVNGRIFRAEGDWRAAPAVVLVHGYNAEFAYYGTMPGWARALQARGINAVLFQLPLHGRRRPPGASPVRNYFSGDLYAVTQAVHHSLVDLHAIVAWLRAQGCPKVGVWGNSLGGWLAGMAVCRPWAPDFAALLSPGARMDRAVRELSFTHTMRAAMDKEALDFEHLSLMHAAPAIDPEDILIIASEHDRFIPMETLEELREHWPGSGLLRVPYGHISVLWAESVLKGTVEWIEERAFAGERQRTVRFITSVPKPAPPIAWRR